jgi:nitronate monooxygenase
MAPPADAVAPTEASRRLGIAYPIVQGPFGGGGSTTLLTTTVSALGGLGSYGAHALEPDAITAVAAELRQRTSRPFALNLWVSDHDPGAHELSADDFEALLAPLRPYFRELGVAEPTLPQRFHPSFDDQVDALLEARPPVFSFVFGIPRPEILAECRRRSITTVGAATSLAEARALADAGVDVIVASGSEAGGHRPSFLAPAEDSLMGTFALVPLLADRVGVPVLAAGGVTDHRGVVAARALGAAGVQVGTAFLACDESGATAEHKALLRTARTEHTVLTRAFTGRLARGLTTSWTAAFAEAQRAPHARLPPFPVQSYLLAPLKRAAIAQGRTDFVSPWCGQAGPNLRFRHAAEVFASLLAPSSRSSAAPTVSSPGENESP